jgi:hypothetical protein
MSWAANREAARPEDLTYCLMGLFHVHMPMIYGEGGEHAFLRLQEEILKISDDESIFAWSSSSYRSPGLLASSPAAFSQSGHIFASKRPPGGKSFTFSNNGISIELPMKMIAMPYGQRGFHGVLDCFGSGGSTTMVGIELAASLGKEETFYRTSKSSLFSVKTSEAAKLRKMKVFVAQSRSKMQGRECVRYLIKATPRLRTNGILLVSGAYDSEGPLNLTPRLADMFFSSSPRKKRYEACPTVGDEMRFSISRPEKSKDWIIGAIRFEFGRQDSFVVLLKKEMWSTSIEIGVSR